MATKSNLDVETKIELLIKLAFGISIEELTKEYSLSKNKIINLRKNNYKIYNEFFNHWKISKDIANLGLSAKHERALNIIKKFYKDKIEIKSASNVLFLNNKINMDIVVDMADKILKKDNINNFKEMKFVKNFY